MLQKELTLLNKDRKGMTDVLKIYVGSITNSLLYNNLGYRRCQLQLSVSHIDNDVL